MEESVYDQRSGIEDPRYQEALSHLQRGEWEAAIKGFEALVQRYPSDPSIRRLLDDARYKFEQDSSTTVRGKRWVLPWRPILFRLLAFTAVALFAFAGWQLLGEEIPPLIEQARRRGEEAQLLAEARSYLEAGNLDAAEVRYEEVLREVPQHTEASRGLESVSAQRLLVTLYDEGVAYQEAGDYREALQRFSDLSVLDAGFRDVRQRILAMQREIELERLFVEAEEAYDEERLADAIAAYEQVRDLDLDYEKEQVQKRLFDLYYRSGSEIVARSPATPSELPAALDYFTLALQLRPRNEDVALQQRLASLFLQGLDAGYAERWNDVILFLTQIHDRDPDYMDGLVVDLLYSAYIRNGDRLRLAGDITLAFDQYGRAWELPVSDPAVALARLDEVRPNLTPTPTPTITPTPTGTPPPTAINIDQIVRDLLPRSSGGGFGSVPPPAPVVGSGSAGVVGTPLPTPTPTPVPLRLTTFHNQIVFTSENPEQPGLWVMDANGGNRRFLGPVAAYADQIEAIRARERLSPDQRYGLLVQDAPGGTAQVFMSLPPSDQFGQLPPKQITNSGELSYDPVWSPDGSLIAFVTQVHNNDEIYVTTPDASWVERLTHNEWEWDKHPSWSFDSSRLVFWSNRTGNKQIHVTNARGGGLRNLSNNGWEEYDPIWIH